MISLNSAQSGVYLDREREREKKIPFASERKYDDDRILGGGDFSGDIRFDVRGAAATSPWKENQKLW